ncbi:immunoglobulin lambda-1 light chain-like [Pimephales promelas]|nr:immunoglobulin lambda-1 light chain-like [Pimephales promelas]
MMIDLHMKNRSIIMTNSSSMIKEVKGHLRAGPTVKPSVSLLPPSSLQISGDSAALLCLLSSYSPQGALVSWTLDGSEVTEGVLTSAESQQDGRYSRSSVLTLSKARWEEGELYVCRVTHDGAPHEVSFHKSSEC